MQVYVTARSYCVEITIEEFKAILDYDDMQDKGDLLSLLESAGARNVEYNGHFGSAIFFDLVDDMQDQLGNILVVINQYIATAITDDKDKK